MWENVGLLINIDKRNWDKSLKFIEALQEKFNDPNRNKISQATREKKIPK